MDLARSYKKRLILFLFVCFIVMFVTYIRAFFSVPGELTLLEGEEYEYDFKSPFLVSVIPDKFGVVKLNNNLLNREGKYFTLANPVMIEPEKNGEVSLNFKILGLIPLRTMKVDIVPNKELIVCGNTIGVKLKIDGILVIGKSEVETKKGTMELPVEQTGITEGDIITHVNDIEINSIDQLITEVNNSNGKKIEIKFRHGNLNKKYFVQPVKSIDDGKYHLGLWVRESSAGIGTLTFYDPDSKCFGALGHGITDVDSGALMSIASGDIMESRILTIKKGKQGLPGELRGVFIEGDENLGNISKNCEFGIYGKLNNSALGRLNYKSYPIALRNQIMEGPATILTNIEDNKVEKFSAEILKVSKYNFTGSKSMVIKITDKKLLAATGGIVQGMSGSPIIQNGKIIGAITHVLINDPTRGYGIFIENMIKSIDMTTENVQTLKKVG